MAPERLVQARERGLEIAVEQADVAATAAQENVDGLADGTMAFTAVNVGGTIVAEDAGLAAGIVTPPALDAGAANQVVSAFTSGSVVLVPTTPTVVQSVTLTVIDGETVDLNARMSFTGNQSAFTQHVVSGYWFRNPTGGTVGIPDSRLADDVSGIAGSTYYYLAAGTLVPAALDLPGAGTWTYDLYAEASVAMTISNRYARAITATRP